MIAARECRRLARGGEASRLGVVSVTPEVSHIEALIVPMPY